MATLQLLVNGADLTAYLEQDSWSISQNWSRQGSTGSFVLTDEHPRRDLLSFTIAPLATVVLTDLDLGQVLFAGLVPQPAVTFPAPTLATWSLECVDWTYLSDRTLVTGDHSGLSADQLAILITQASGCGISAATPADGGFVQPGPQIPRIQFSADTLTNCWTKLSKLASVSETYGWYVDENLCLHFHTLTQAPDSGITLTDDLTAVTATVQPYANDSMSYAWDATSIRNTITVRGADYSQQWVDKFVGDGSTASFPLTYTPDQQQIDHATLTVGGVAQTVSAQTGSSADTDWVLTVNTAGQWFLGPNTAATPAAAMIIEIGYLFVQPVVSILSDPTSVARFAGLPNAGRFGYYIADTTLMTLLAAQQRARREVNTYGQPAERLSVSLVETFTGHLRAGQLVTIANGMVPDSAAGYAPGINDQFLVVQARISGRPGLYRTYDLTATRV